MKKVRKNIIAPSGYTHFLCHDWVKKPKSVYFRSPLWRHLLKYFLFVKCFDILVLRAVTGPNFKENGQFLAIFGFCSLFFQENIFSNRAHKLRNICVKNFWILVKIVLDVSWVVAFMFKTLKHYLKCILGCLFKFLSYEVGGTPPWYNLIPKMAWYFKG